MQAIILAAGMGRRLGDLTKNNTKCMIEVNGITLIDRLLSQLAKLNLNKVIIVVGYEGQKLIDYIVNNHNDVNIEYIRNDNYEKTNNIYSLSLAERQLQEDDTLLIESDLIFDSVLFEKIIHNENPNVAIIAKYDTWMDGTMVQIDEDNNIVNFVPKKAFKYSDANSYYKTVNIYKFSKEFSKTYYVPFLKAYCEALGNNEYYEQVLRVITHLDNKKLKALPLTDEKWYEIDDIQDLHIAETLFAHNENQLKKYQSCYGGYWRYPKLIDFCYLVNPYFPTSRMKDEMRANFDTLLTEYPSGMNINSMLAGKYFGIKQDYIVVGNGAAELIKSLMEIPLLVSNIGMIYPTFEEYPNRVDNNNITYYIPQNKDFKYSVNDIKQYFETTSIKTLLLINPDNPSGNFIPMNELIDLIGWCKNKQIRLIIDESFVDFTDDNETNSLLTNSVLEENPNLIVIKSISKSYGVPGLRLGILATSNKELIKYLKHRVSIWNINSFAEFYMQIFGKYEADYKNACIKFIDERNHFFNELQQIPFLHVIPSQANYFLCEVINTYTSKELTKILLSKFNILIKDCGSKMAFGSNYVRIAIRSRSDNKELINSLKLIQRV